MSRATPPRHAPAPHRRGFTLVELLVSIAIIAVLIGLLFPALGFARQRSWDAGCLANMKHSSTAWQAYTVDHGHFPHAELPDDMQRLQTQMWAGVDWYSDELRQNGEGTPDADRPLNAYLGMDPRQTTGGDVVRCPGDDRMFYTDVEGFTLGEPNVQELPHPDPRYRNSRSPDGNRSFHGCFGNSYLANDWAWVSPSAPFGFDASRESHRRLWLSFENGPEDYEDPSRFVLLTEHGIGNVMRLTTYRAEFDFNTLAYQQHNFRHGEYRSAMAFLDGAARFVDMEIGHNVGWEDLEYDFSAWPRKVASIRAAEEFSYNGQGFSGNIPPSIADFYGVPE